MIPTKCDSSVFFVRDIMLILFLPVLPESGSGSIGSICFWAIRIRLRILQSSSKNCKKTLIPTVLWLLYDFLSLKNDVNIPTESNKQKNLDKNKFLLKSWKSLTKKQDPDPNPDPDPLVRGIDPRIRIRFRTKISWTRYTGFYCWIYFFSRIRSTYTSPSTRLICTTVLFSTPRLCTFSEGTVSRDKYFVFCVCADGNLFKNYYFMFNCLRTEFLVWHEFEKV